jgi:hypothetical protein
MVFQGLLIIDREDVNSQVFKGKYQLTELDVALTRVNQTLALKKVPFRLKAGFVERLEITGLFLTDAIDGHFDSDVSMTVKGVHLLFEVLTHAEVAKDAEEAKVKAALTPKKTPAKKKPTGKGPSKKKLLLVKSLMQRLSVAFQQIHIRFEDADADGSGIAFGTVINCEMHCPDGVNLTYKDSKVVKEFVYSSPQFYFDAHGGGEVKHTINESTGKCEAGFLADMKAAIESKDGKQDFWIDSQEAGQESSKVSFQLTACRNYGVLNAKGSATDSVSSVTMRRSLCLVLTKQQVSRSLCLVLTKQQVHE